METWDGVCLFSVVWPLENHLNMKHFIWVSHTYGANWNLEILVYEERGKPEYAAGRKTSRSNDKDKDQQQTQPTYNSLNCF